MNSLNILGFGFSCHMVLNVAAVDDRSLVSMTSSGATHHT